MTLARKVFSASVTLPAATQVSMATLMNGSILHWWEEDDGSPSMDASSGSEASVTPQDGTVYVGSTANVFDVNADPNYQGVPVAQNQNYSLQDFGHGLIDPNQIWFYASGQRTLSLVFQGY